MLTWFGDVERMSERLPTKGDKNVSGNVSGKEAL